MFSGVLVSGVLFSVLVGGVIAVFVHGMFCNQSPLTVLWLRGKMPFASKRLT